MGKVILLLVFIGILFSGCIGVGEEIGPEKHITHEYVLDYAKENQSIHEVMSKRIELGYLEKTQVVAWFPCSDLCPDYTRKIIHYNTTIDKCWMINGSVEYFHVPMGIGTSLEKYCVPKIISENGLANQRFGGIGFYPYNISEKSIKEYEAREWLNWN